MSERLTNVKIHNSTGISRWSGTGFKKNGDEETTVIFWILLVVGMIIWISIAMHSGK